MYIIVGLGNPGIAYSNTRHNTGYKVLDNLAENLDIKISKKKFEGVLGEGQFANEKVILIKPETYMNASGDCVYEIMSFYKLDLDKLIVVYDDIDLPVGKIRVKASGSAGTHNGMRSIVTCLDSEKFARVRVGIGKPRPEIDLADYVLGQFYFEDEDKIKEGIDNATNAIECIIREGIQSAMTKYN